MVFASREDAGRKLSLRLKGEGITPDIVLGLPRGGVIVAAEVADELAVPLDVLVVRKIGHPRHREFAVGALAEPDIVMLDEDAISRTFVSESELNEVIAEEKERLAAYVNAFERGTPVELADKRVLIVDDGLATGSTMEAAVRGAKQRKAAEVYVAVPVASDGAVDRISEVADRVIAIAVDPDFDAVGRYYEVFAQTTDQEVLELLHGGKALHRKAARQ